MNEKVPLSKLAPAYIAVYAVWVAFFVAGFWLIPQVRILLLDLAGLTPANRWILSAIDRYATLLLGLIWLVIVLYVEHYLRTAVEAGRLGRRILRVVLWFVGFALAIFAGQYVVEVVIG